MPFDLEAGPRLARSSWLSSLYQVTSHMAHLFFERSFTRPRWLRIFLAISLGYLILTFAHITTSPMSMDVVDMFKPGGGSHGATNQPPLQPNPSQNDRDKPTPPTKPGDTEKLTPVPAEPVAPDAPSSTVTEPPKSTFNTKPYVQGILNRDDKTLERQSCNNTNTARYDYLRVPQVANGGSAPVLKYFFALDLHKSITILTSLIGGVVEVMRYLGPESCALSIVEGRSEDGTAEVLRALVPVLNAAGISYTLQINQTDPKEPGGDRIARLAGLRNQALEPLFTHPKSQLDDDPVIVFPNDVPLCADDLLELIHQKVVQKADVVCSMDWNMGGLIFYDAWVARDIYGEPFYEVLQGGEWKYAKNLFPNNRESKRRFEHRKPFQVYACWNGIAVLNSAPFLKDGMRFRGRKNQDECEIGEPTYLAKDLWNANYTRIITVPSVAVAYNLREGQESKDNYGSTSYNVEQFQAPNEPAEQELITDWKPQPPYMVCAPGFTPRWWVSTRS